MKLGTIDYTTNYFQAYDVALATNVNNITLRMTDRSGNTTTTNFNVTLDYTGATNPAVSLTWPTNGMEVCQSSFTLRGWTDDSAATVAATITDTNGDTSTVSGEVERSGVLWVDNLPLAEGTNWVTLWVTNSAGLSSETNMAVVKNDMTLALTSIDGDLWNPTVNVSGVISDPGYSVWVNGVQGTNYGDGTWGATNVPVSAGGVASFDMSASSGGGDPDSNTNMDKPAEIVTVQYGDGKSAIGLEQGWNHTTHTRTKNYNNNYTMDANGQYASQGWVETVVDYDGDTASGGGWSDYVMSSTNPGVYYEHDIPDTGADSYGMGFIGGDEDSNYQITSVPDEDLDEMGDAGYTGYGDTGGWVSHYFADKVHWAWDGGGNHEDLTVGARIRQKLLRGGRGKSGLMNLFCISATGTVKNGEPGETSQWQGTQELGVDYTTIQVNGMNLGADGNLWVPEPDNAAPDLVVTIPGVRHFNAWPGVQEYTLTVGNSDDPSADVPERYISQLQIFEPVWTPSIPPFVDSVQHWTIPGNYVNEQPYSYCSAFYDKNSDLLTNYSTYCWYVDALQSGKVSVGMNLHFSNGQYASIAAESEKFTVLRPQPPSINVKLDEPIVANNYIGDDITIDFLFSPDDKAAMNGTLHASQLVNQWTSDDLFSNDVCSSTTSGTYFLDTMQNIDSDHYFNPTNYYTANFQDSPHLSSLLGFYSFGEMYNSFKFYLFYTHDSFGSIPVTIARVDWAWHGSGNYGGGNRNGGKWTQTSSPPDEGYSSHPDADDFPYWQNIFNPNTAMQCH